MLEVPNAYSAGQFNVLCFHGICEQMSHQDVPVNTTVPDSASIGLMVLLIDLCKIGSVWHDSWF